MNRRSVDSLTNTAQYALHPQQNTRNTANSVGTAAQHPPTPSRHHLRIASTLSHLTYRICPSRPRPPLCYTMMVKNTLPNAPSTLPQLFNYQTHTPRPLIPKHPVATRTSHTLAHQHTSSLISPLITTCTALHQHSTTPTRTSKSYTHSRHNTRHVP